MKQHLLSVRVRRPEPCYGAWFRPFGFNWHMEQTKRIRLSVAVHWHCPSKHERRSWEVFDEKKYESSGKRIYDAALFPYKDFEGAFNSRSNFKLLRDRYAYF